uniref:Uncharacterized protein n=1 Tax=Leersia perrieri TaxID=77586 RepID=A0A0D9XGM7_9ORYZ
MGKVSVSDPSTWTPGGLKRYQSMTPESSTCLISPTRPSTICQYFTYASGVNGNLKRQGMFDVPYPPMQQVGNRPLQLDAGRGLETEDGDIMVLG